MIEYNIISTGSKGNAVVINNIIMIDCGVPFKALEKVYRNLGLVLLTHKHTDHLKRSAIKKIAQERPTLRFGCPDWLACDVLDLVEPRNIDVYDMDTAYTYGDTVIKPVPLVHDVPNCGYEIKIAGKSLFYATDTNSLDGIEAKGFDLYMIEANYNEAEIVERIRLKQESGEYCHEWDVLKNHLSKEKADDWLYQNMSANSAYVYLHGHAQEA